MRFADTYVNGRQIFESAHALPNKTEAATIYKTPNIRDAPYEWYRGF